jgi:RHS repeat-associated protein
LKYVETSKDDIFWEREAAYTYYLHGPLKRMEIGHDKVQGMDYAYTIQGWLKAMNHVEAAHDMGKDGSENGNPYIPKDVYGMILSYHQNDYISKTSRLNAVATNPYHLTATAGRDLFNGNISTWTQRYDLETMNVLNPTLAFEDKANITGRQFEYDELNRLKRAFYNVSYPAWNLEKRYRENFGYDANGNILTLSRTGYGNTAALEAMDNMTYNYYSPTTNNRLQNVTDAGDNTNPLRYADIKSQTLFPNNYTYDAIGNLTSDGQEGISSIEWNLSGKVSKIVKSISGTNQTIEFLYDATGQRVAKKVFDHTAADQQLAATTTYYVKDASGNTMAVYKRTNTGTSPNYTAKFDLQEQPVYGSDRIGQRTLNNLIFRNVNYTGANTPVGQNLPLSQHISAWPKLAIPLSNTTAKQLYTRKLNSNSSTNVAADIGATEQATTEISTSTITLAHGRSQASLMDEYGNVILSAYVHTSNSSGTTGIPRVYAYSSILVSNGNLINASPVSQSIFVKKPGSAGEYYYITVGNDGKPYYHTIDLTTLQFTNYNNLMENVTGYGNGMAVIDDRVGEGLSTLYMRQLTGTTTSIKLFNITATGIVPSTVTPVTFASDAATGPDGEIQISSDGLKLAVASTTGSIGEVRVYNISADHQTLTSRGRLAMNASTRGRHVEFTHTDLRLYFTQTAPATSVTTLYYVPVSSFVNASTNLGIAAATSVTTITAPVTGGIRRGSNNSMYFTSNTTVATTTLAIRMITNTEAAPSVGAANTITGVATNAALPIHPHVIDYSTPTSLIPVLARNYQQKVYELKDHLGNVHGTVQDYKIPITDANLLIDRRFDNATTEGFVVGTGSPGGTTVSNVNNSMQVLGTLNSTALLNLPVATLTNTAGNRYVLSFDYTKGTASAASYCVSTNGSSMIISGSLTDNGRYSIPFSLPTAGTTSTDFRFICQDAAAGKSFFIDNLNIKSIGTTLTDAVTVLDHTGITPSGWISTNGTISYAVGNVGLSNGVAVTTANVRKDFNFIPGMVYKVAFTLTATTVGTGAPKISFMYADKVIPGVTQKALIRTTTGSAAYEYYFVPEQSGGTISFIYENTTAQAYNFTVNNLVITQFENRSKAMYVAAISSLQDYYAFGMPMPGRGYSGGGYRYGFNGQEKDNEITGVTGSHLDFGERIYDCRLGKFLSVDKLTSSYPWWSPYAFAGNTPIQAIDLDGLEIYYSQSGQKIGTYGTSTEIRVINEDQLATATTEFAAYTTALKTDPAATNEFLGSALSTTGSVAYNDYFTSVTDVTNGAALETYGDNGNNCNTAAKAQLANEGVTQTGPYKAIQTKVDNTTQADNGKPDLTENAIGGSIYIQTQLNKGNPVMVGLEEQNSSGNIISSTIVPNHNALTGHFVVINSSTVDASGNVTFGYMDNASSRCGTSTGNQFSLNKTTGAMTDSTSPCVGGVSGYQVTEVRKNQ